MASVSSSRAAVLLAGIALLLAAGAEGRVLYGKKEALEKAFPEADRVEKVTHFLTDEQIARVKELSGADVKDKLVTWHVGYRGDAIEGYAYFETHNVRTLPETLLVVVTPSGEVRNVLLLAFYEPPEYEPGEKWLEQFDAKKLGADLRVMREIHGITGATLTARAVTGGVRRALALFQVLIAGGK